MKRWASVVSILAATAFVTTALVGYDPADPPTEFVFPPNRLVKNPCGPVGAWIASSLIEVSGLGAGLLTLLGLAAALSVWRQRPWSDFRVKTFGFVLLMIGASGMLHRLPPVSLMETPKGPGGMLGAVIAHFLVEKTSAVGSLLILMGFVVSGSVLGLEGLFGIALRGLRFVASLAWRCLGRVASYFSSGEDELTSDEPSALPAPTKIRIAPASISEEEPKVVAAALPPERIVSSEPIAVVSAPVEPPPSAVEAPLLELRINRPATDAAPIALPAPIPLPSAAPAFKLPDTNLLDAGEPFEYASLEQDVRDEAKLVELTFAQFQMKVRVVQIDTGPVVTQYEIELEPGLRARRVKEMGDDLAIALRAPTVRIVAPIPGKNTVGIEVPNKRRAKVTLAEVMQSSASTAAAMKLPLFLGKDVKGQPLLCDLANMPHLLVAGRTGTGKSVCLNALIMSVLMTKTPEQVKMLMIDPKMVELSLYKDIPHLLHPVVTDTQKAEAILGWAVDKMEERYALLARLGVRHIDAYNRLVPEEIHARLGSADDADVSDVPTRMPYIVIVADEMADLVMTAPKEVESYIVRLAQKSRAVGIHLVLATQKPVVDVITGLIKSNLPSRIAFQVASKNDSRVVLDESGAEKLLGNGDMLFLYPGTSKLTRAQGTYVSDEELTRVTRFLCAQGRPQYSTELIQLPTAKGGEAGGKALSARDELYEQAIDVIVREQRGSVSLLQRALGVGYGRGARLIDFMAEDGIVGQYNGSQAREVLISLDQWEQIRIARFQKAG